MTESKLTGFIYHGVDGEGTGGDGEEGGKQKALPFQPTRMSAVPGYASFLPYRISMRMPSLLTLYLWIPQKHNFYKVR